MKLTKYLMIPAMVASLSFIAGCPDEGDDDDDDNNNNTSACDDNFSDGAAAPASAKALTLGTKATGKVCTDKADRTGTDYYYWKATGTYAATDEFKLELALKDSAAGDSVTCYAGGAGTYSQSVGTTTASNGSATDMTENISAIQTGGSSAVYVICYATASGTDVKALNVEITLTKEAP